MQDPYQQYAQFTCDVKENRETLSPPAIAKLAAAVRRYGIIDQGEPGGYDPGVENRDYFRSLASEMATAAANAIAEGNPASLTNAEIIRRTADAVETLRTHYALRAQGQKGVTARMHTEGMDWLAERLQAALYVSTMNAFVQSPARSGLLLVHLETHANERERAYRERCQALRITEQTAQINPRMAQHANAPEHHIVARPASVREQAIHMAEDVLRERALEQMRTRKIGPNPFPRYEAVMDDARLRVLHSLAERMQRSGEAVHENAARLPAATLVQNLLTEAAKAKGYDLSLSTIRTK
ncbi:MAG: hypothetical protein K2Q01_08305 [Rickettsiales bacterium]|nr:hypothetical protein [Rickettsiales bacterium]